MLRIKIIPNISLKAKRILTAMILILIGSISTTLAQSDTMYIMKYGNVIGKYNINTEIDSIIFYKPQIQSANTFIDSRDGEVYHTITIGNQIWMAENLKYLPGVVGPAVGSETTPYYYVYGLDDTNVTNAKATANYQTYGVLYNWKAAMNGAVSSTTNPSNVQGVCPAGWHLPSDAEWTELTDFLGGENVAGGKLKETGTTHWIGLNEGATNETGFSALPGGNRDPDEGFNNLGFNGLWWSSTELEWFDAYYRSITGYTSSVTRTSFNKGSGYSVRCVKD